MQQLIDLPYLTDSEPLFARICDLAGAIWFDSGKPASNYGRYDIFSALPSATLESINGETLISDGDGTQATQQDPFVAAQTLLDSLSSQLGEEQHLPFSGGLAGYFSYDLGNRLEGITPSKDKLLEFPEIRLGLYHWSLIIDHQRQLTQLFFLDSCAEQTIATIKSRLTATATLAVNEFCLNEMFTPSSNKHQYLRAVQKIDNYIHAGDCYQVNFSQHFSSTFNGDSWQAYRLLRRAIPSPFSVFMAWEKFSLLSISPERFLSVVGGTVEAKPIKGTIKRSDNSIADIKNRDTLLNSHKDRAENLMIVDLLRNDLGKSCTPGSINVKKLFNLESYANVHHLVSTISGQLAPQKSSLNLLQAAFPSGSVTGAPKHRAMQIIDELEESQRSIYCGSIGYLSRCGRMDTNVAIRTLLTHNNTIHCWGGGGIVADSIPDCEYEESLDKVNKLMMTLEATRVKLRR